MAPPGVGVEAEPVVIAVQVSSALQLELEMFYQVVPSFRNYAMGVVHSETSQLQRACRVKIDSATGYSAPARH